MNLNDFFDVELYKEMWWAQEQFNGTQMRNGLATPILLGGNLSRSSMSISLPPFPSLPSDNLYDVVEITIPPTMQVGSARRRAPSADARCGPGGYAKIIWRKEYVPEEEFLMKSHAANSKPWKDIFVVRYSVKISAVQESRTLSPSWQHVASQWEQETSKRAACQTSPGVKPARVLSGTREVHCTAAQPWRLIVFLSCWFSLMKILFSSLNIFAVKLVVASTPSPIDAFLVPHVKRYGVDCYLCRFHFLLRFATHVFHRSKHRQLVPRQTRNAAWVFLMGRNVQGIVFFFS